MNTMPCHDKHLTVLANSSA